MSDGVYEAAAAAGLRGNILCWTILLLLFSDGRPSTSIEVNGGGGGDWPR